jgi:hypothetical protein
MGYLKKIVSILTFISLNFLSVFSQSQLLYTGFEGASAPAGFTTITTGGSTWDLNSTGGSPPVGSKEARLSYNTSNDSWFITSGVPCVAGHSYFMEFRYKRSGGVGRLIGTVGTNSTIATQTTTLFSSGADASTFTVGTSSSFSCGTTGTYYFGIRSRNITTTCEIDELFIYEDCSSNVLTASNPVNSNTTSVAPSYNNAEVLKIELNSTINNCAVATSFTLNANGTTSVSDIKNARLWYTGTNPSFSTNTDQGTATTLFGSNAAPTIANFVIAGTQTLSAGTNYFWLTYDVKGTATVGNTIDAEFINCNIATPSITNSSGNRIISYPTTLPANFRTESYSSDLGQGTAVVAANTFTIPVNGSGITNPLSSSCNLREVNVKFYGGSNESIDQYTVTIKAPGGTSLVLFRTGSFSGLTGGYVDAKWRYSSNLYEARASNYSSGGNDQAPPFDQGYFKSENSFSAFSGINPIGTWSITITENASATTDDFKLDFVNLEFGPDFVENDVKTQGDNCSDPVVMTNGIYLGSTAYNPAAGNSKTAEAWDPSSSDNVFCGLGWNSSNDNSQWFSFVATQTNISLSVSGQLYDGINNNKLQAIVVENQSSACSGAATNWTVSACPSGVNNYPSTAKSGAYANMKFDFTAVVGYRYFLVVDGSAGGKNNFYVDFTGSDPLLLLPIELTRFEGDCSNGSVILNWQTATEKNNSQFNIQRSSDGIYFETIGVVFGAGNSIQLLNYTFVDEEDIDGISYYRLTQTDYDGKESQSKIIAVEHVCGQKQTVEVDVHPNPSHLNFVLNVKLFKKSEISIEILDGLGRIVKVVDARKYDLGIHNIDINAADFETGVYFLKVVVNNKTFNQKILIL